MYKPASSLAREVEYVQNPALGGMLLWNFTVGYEYGSKTRSAAPMPLMFIVLPIILHESTLHFVSNTQRKTGLRSFAAKFSTASESKSDLILAIHDRAIHMRGLTMESLGFAVSSSLLELDFKKGTIIPLSRTPSKTNIPQSIREMFGGSRKIGYWCSKLPIYEISNILKVRF